LHISFAVIDDGYIMAVKCICNSVFIDLFELPLPLFFEKKLDARNYDILPDKTL